VVVPAQVVGTKFGSARVAVENLQGVLDVDITIVVEKEKVVFGCATSAAMNSELHKVSNCTQWAANGVLLRKFYNSAQNISNSSNKCEYIGGLG